MAYGLEDRELLWRVLTRYGVPAKIIAIICQIHNGCGRVCGKKAQVLGLVCSIDVERGLRQGCVPVSLLMFNIYLAAVLPMALQRFEAEPEISTTW